MVAWLSLLVAVAIGGQALGGGALAPPSLGDPGSWAEWANGRTPLEASFAVLGLLVVVLAWYLLAATLLVAAARLRGAGRLVSVAEVLTLPVVRRTVHALLGVGLVGTSVAGGAAQGGPPLPRQVTLVELVVVTSPDGASGFDDTDRADDEQEPVMRLLPDGPGAEMPPAPESQAAVPPGTMPLVQGVEREVRPGDHLWSLAAHILGDAGADASHAAVATYWRQLIDANLDRLADPANPDLIFPGQVLAVPAPPTATPAR